MRFLYGSSWQRRPFLPLVSFVLSDGERNGLWWPALSWHWFSCTGCYQHLFNMKFFNVWTTVVTIVNLSRMFPPTDFLFVKRIGLVSMDLILSYLHTILRIICRDVSCLTTDYPCGVWGRGCWVVIIVFVHCPNVTFIIPLTWFHSEIAFLFEVLSIIFHRGSLFSFLLEYLSCLCRGIYQDLSFTTFGIANSMI